MANRADSPDNAPSSSKSDTNLGRILYRKRAAKPENKAPASVACQPAGSAINDGLKVSPKEVKIVGKMRKSYDNLTLKAKYLFLDDIISSSDDTTLKHIQSQVNPALIRDYISEIPASLALDIFYHLDLPSLYTALQVSKNWNKLLSNNPSLWRRLCLKYMVVDKFEPEIYANPWEFLRRSILLDRDWRDGSNSRITSLNCHGKSVVTCLILDGPYVITASDDHKIKVWSADRMALERELVGHGGGVWALAKDGDTLVSGSTDRTVRVWNVATGVMETDLIGHTSTVRCVQMNADWIVSGSRDATIRVWDRRTFGFVHLLAGHLESVRCLSLKDDTLVSGSYDTNACVWNVRTGQLVHKLVGHADKIYSLDFSGEYIATGSMDTSVRVWDVETGKCLRVFRGHRGLTGSLQIYKNMVISGNTESTVRAWDIPSGLPIFNFQNHNPASAISSIQCDGTHLVTGSDNALKLYCLKKNEYVRNLIDGVDVIWRVAFNKSLCAAVGQSGGNTFLKIIHFSA